MATVTDHKVTKADIQAKLREIRGGMDQTAEHTTNFLIIAGTAGVVFLLGAAYLMGRRKGKKKTTVVEIRRI